MNESAMKAFLREILNAYADNIVFPDFVIAELLELLAGSGNEKQVLNKLMYYLDLLIEEGDDAIGGRGGPMEHLKRNASLCAMRFNFAESNVRLLFALVDGKAYFLRAFYERAGHRNTEYAVHIPVAEARLESLLKENG